MNTEEVSVAIERLQRQKSDDGLIEAKSCADNLSKGVWETVSAFANTHGGTLILGLSETDGFIPVDSFDLNRVRDQFVSGASPSNPSEAKVNPVPSYGLQRIEYLGKPLLVIDIAELPQEQKPCYVKGRGIPNGCFKRVNDRDERLSSAEIYELMNSMLPSKADREIVAEATFNDLNNELVDALLDEQKNSKALRKVSTKEEALFRLNVLDSDHSVRLAGLLVLGNYPQQFFPKILIDVTAHPGVTKSYPNAPRFLDRVLCEGYLGEVIEDAIAAILKNIKTYSYVSDTTRRDEPEIPVEVLREAIVNAVVHREYSQGFQGQSVSVDIFSDRVEITSPGGLWGGKTLENLDDGQSRCRNETLMKLLSIMPYPHSQGAYSEGQGSGINMMINEMKTRALGKPGFQARIDSFTVTLSRGGAELSQINEWIEGECIEDLSRRERSILAVLKRNKEIDVYDLHKALGIDSYEIKASLDYLEMIGILKETGLNRYALIEKNGSARHLNAYDELLDVLSYETPMGIHDLEELTGKKTSTLRAQLAKLVAQGLVQPTAPPTSRNRKYIKRR